MQISRTATVVLTPLDTGAAWPDTARGYGAPLVIRPAQARVRLSDTTGCGTLGADSETRPFRVEHVELHGPRVRADDSSGTSTDLKFSTYAVGGMLGVLPDDGDHMPDYLHWPDFVTKAARVALAAVNAGLADALLCDECYELVTGLLAECQDHCSLDLDHDGQCGPRAARSESRQESCDWCGRTDRLTFVEAENMDDLGTQAAMHGSDRWAGVPYEFQSCIRCHEPAGRDYHLVQAGAGGVTCDRCWDPRLR
jgi:hypothetical protein